MSHLSITERAYLEKLLDMGGGYVLTFSDSSIAHFFADTIGIDIHDQKYQTYGSSKAKKLRAFWQLAPDHLVGKSIAALVEHVEAHPPFDGFTADKAKLIQFCKDIANRLLSGKLNLDHLKETATIFDARHLAEQISRAEKAVQSDPALAIGTAKEIIETCCKTILAERGKTLPGTPDIPELTKATLKELKLVPDGIDQAARGSDVLKRILRSLGSIGNDLAELRGLYGTGHGKHGATEPLSPRHAKLAVGTASTFATFLFDTHKETHRR